MTDCHIHVVPPNLPGVGPLTALLTQSPHDVAEQLRQEMRSAGVTRALAMGHWQAAPDDPLGVRSTLAIAELVPGLAAIGILDPCKGHDRDHLRRVEAELKLGRVVALKAYLGYLHFEPSSPSYRPYYELATRYRVPVFFHCGDTFSPYAKLKFAHPLGVDEVAVDYPDCRFIIAHAGNPWMMDCAQVVYKNLNVWADVSGLCVGDAESFIDEERMDAMSDVATNLRRAFRYAERPNRFLFGTDWPLIPIQGYRQFIASAVPAKHHLELFAENAQTLFRLG